MESVRVCASVRAFIKEFLLAPRPIERTYAEKTEKLNLERGRKNGLFQRKGLFQGFAVSSN